MSISRGLSRENQQAINVLINYLPNYQMMNINSLSEVGNMYTTNTMFFINESLTPSNIPKGDWLWNKSRPAINAILEGNIHVSFYKLNARKTNDTLFFSKIKIWLFTISVNSTFHSSFFWCETGAPVDIQMVPVKLEDLSFLREYMPPNTARLFGWE